MRSSRLFHTTTSLQSRQIKPGIGPKTAEKFETMALIAFFTGDPRYSDKEHVYDFQTHMAGFGLCGKELNPLIVGNANVMQAVNRQRNLSFSILAARYPGVLIVAQRLEAAKQHALNQPRNKAADEYFNKLQELFKITIENEARQGLKKGEFLPEENHPVLQLIKRMVNNLFGDEVHIGPYTKDELEVDSPKIIKELVKIDSSIPHALLKFDITNFNNQIAAATESEHIQRLSM